MISRIEALTSALPIPLARPQLDDDEIAALLEVARSGQLCQGEATERFEHAMAEVVGVPYAVAVSSGSAALLVTMQAMGIGAGDEVVVPDITFVSTATAAVYLGATPIFCDIALDNYCIDVEKIASHITPRTKLIAPVHLGGRVADVIGIRERVRALNIPILEDAAAAHHASRDGIFAGAMGDAAIFSFTPTKLITTGEGGMIVTGDAGLAERCRRIRNFGDYGKFAWNTLGFNFRMTAFSAAIGSEQVGRLSEMVQQRQALADHYNDAFNNIDGLRLPLPLPGERPNHQLYTMLFDEQCLGVSRDEIQCHLSQEGIESRLYYPPLHNMPVFDGIGWQHDGDFSAAVRYEKSALSLPIFAGMSDGEQQRVIDAVLKILAAAPASTSSHA